MTASPIETDYLIVGTGATAMAFAAATLPGRRAASRG